MCETGSVRHPWAGCPPWDVPCSEEAGIGSGCDVEGRVAAGCVRAVLAGANVTEVAPEARGAPGHGASVGGPLPDRPAGRVGGPVAPVAPVAVVSPSGPFAGRGSGRGDAP